MVENRILSDFIANKQLDYEEPERKGTPRGEKIGFPSHKYLASLFVGLTNLSQKKIAEDLGPKHGIKYGVLRNWCREKTFQEQAKEHAIEFAWHIIQHVEGKLETDKKKWDDYFNCKTDKKPSPLVYKEIVRDAGLFSVNVLNILTNLNFARFDFAHRKRKTVDIDADALLGEFVLFNTLNAIIQFANKEKPSEKVEVFAQRGMVGLIKSIVSSKRVLSKQEQRVIVHGLEVMEESLEETINEETRSKIKMRRGNKVGQK